MGVEDPAHFAGFRRWSKVIVETVDVFSSSEGRKDFSAILFYFFDNVVVWTAYIQ